MAEPVHTDPSFNPHARGHQEDKIDIRSIFLFGAGLVTVMVVVFLVLGWMMTRFATADRNREALRPALFDLEEGQYPGPRLQEAPPRDMGRMNREVSERLSSFGWVDRESKIAHIPIDRAIKITAQNQEKLLPVRSTSDEQGATEE